MAELRAILPEILARAIHDRLTGIARHVGAVHRTAGSDHEDADSPPATAGARGLDQIRADVLADLLLTAAPTSVDRTALDAISATVQVTLAASTLAGEDDHPAEHDGHGPLDPALARLLAGGATTWTRLFLDPAGQVIQTDGYSPTASMRRHLRARDQHCRFPSCRVPARRCDIDHNHDHARGGATRIGNLSLFCRRHHTLKHPDLDDGDRWSVEQLSGGRLRWRSPLGRTYEDTPPPRVMFG